MDQAIDQLVEQVQERIESWGIAVAGGYWKPVLNVEVAPGAEPQFQELQTVLRDSGIDLIRKR